MTLYEINSEILNLIDENGEIADFEQFSALQMQREEKIENTALYVKNLTAETAAIKAEEAALAERRKAKENLADRLKGYISSALEGEKFETARVKVSYRKSESVEIPDECSTAFIDWAKEHHPDFLSYKEPTVSKSAVKDAMKSGEDVPFAQIASKQNLQIK